MNNKEFKCMIESTSPMIRSVLTIIGDVIQKEKEKFKKDGFVIDRDGALNNFRIKGKVKDTLTQLGYMPTIILCSTILRTLVKSNRDSSISKESLYSKLEHLPEDNELRMCVQPILKHSFHSNSIDAVYDINQAIFACFLNYKVDLDELNPIITSVCAEADNFLCYLVDLR